MKLDDLNSQVNAELAHIPDWPEPQGELRVLYNLRRMRNLGKEAKHQKTPSQILAECIAYLKVDYPNYEFEYDREFFAEITEERYLQPGQLPGQKGLE